MRSPGSLAALLLVLLLTAGGCSSSDAVAVDNPEPLPAPTSTASASASTSVVSAPDGSPGEEANDAAGTEPTEFCDEFNKLANDEVPEAYVGSAQHLADVESMQHVAPAVLDADFSTFRDYIASGAIDAEGNPESTLFDEWPLEVRVAITRIQDFGTQNC